MKKLLSILTVLAIALGFSVKAYNCPENLYFYISDATTSTPFTKSQTVFTHTVDATASDVFGVIVNYNATSWSDAQSHNGYFANGKYGDILVSGPEKWTTVAEWTGSANNNWSNGCYKFAKGKKYKITLTHANGAFTGNVSVDGEEYEEPIVKKFDTNKDYYLDASKCSWFFDGGALIKVWDGASDVECEKVAGSIVKFHPTAEGTNGLMYVKRINPKNTGETWNEYALAAPDNDEHNMFIINSGFSGGEWDVYTTPEAWVISQNINGWSAAEVSEYKFDYDDATGLYTVSVPAEKLRTDDADNNGFKIGYGALNNWDNYYGAMIANKVMGKGVVNEAVKNGKNFLIPTTATTPVKLTFDVKEGKLTADWDITVVDPIDPIDPEDSDDTLKVNLPKMDVNGSITVEVTLQAAADKDYCTAQWDIIVPEGFKVSDIKLNKERCTDHEIVTNVVDGVTKCIVYSMNNTPFVRASRPLFSFTLSAEDVAVGEFQGSLSNIRFSIPPKEGNLNITSRFADTPLNITIVKAVSKISADPANLALATGESATINISIEPSDATDKSVTWEVVSGTNVIDLDDEGKVTAKASGVATIKVTANDGFGAYVDIDVTVDGKKVENIEISATEHTMYVGETTTLSAIVTPEDATNKGIMWVSSDDNVATVDADGLVTGISAGEAIIHAIAKDGSGVEATCTVTIKAKVSGDADGDDQLTIADIVIIVKRVVEIMTEGAILENMDMDGDGVITSTDVTLAVYYLNQQTINEMPASAQISSNMLKLTTPVATGSDCFVIPLYLANASDVAGIQFDIVLPEGLELTSDSYVAPEAANSHIITTADLGDNTYRIVIYSAYNFNSNAIGYLAIRNSANICGNADFDLNNVMYSNGNNLIGTDDSRTTLNIISGVDGIYLSDDMKVDVYNTSGVLVAKQADKATVKALPAGIYLIGNKKVAVF